jgi:hypothetical protein
MLGLPLSESIRCRLFAGIPVANRIGVVPEPFSRLGAFPPIVADVSLRKRLRFADRPAPIAFAHSRH